MSIEVRSVPCGGKILTAWRTVRLPHWCALLCALASSAAPSAEAPAYPQRQVRMVVPFPAGGTSDTLARIVAERLAARWQQPVVVENQSGANGIVAAEAVSRAPADGYTLLFSPLGPVAINALLYRQLPYAPQQFLPLSMVGTIPSVLAVRTSLPATSVQDLAALLRAAPDQYTYGSQGVGSTSHLTAALFEARAGLRLRHIPYNGSRAALTDLTSGQIDVFFDNLSTPLPLHRAGRVKILAVASLRRAPLLPEVPTLHESGWPGFESLTTNLLVAPAGLPPALAAHISAATGAALALPEVQGKLASQGILAGGGTPEETAQFVAAQSRLWQQVIQSAGIRIE